ncbi:MAG: hypothetical protein LBO79_04690 [Zoogloeaceae bacterium]|jgi:hypothetical protein|nr:hypothetical protein [Zoogloeaceae bacterium]
MNPVFAADSRVWPSRILRACLLSFAILLAACSEPPEASGTLARLGAQRIDDYLADTPGSEKSVARLCANIPAYRHDECRILFHDALQSEFFRRGLQEILSDTYSPQEMEALVILGNIVSLRKDIQGKMARVTQEEVAFQEIMMSRNIEDLAAANYTDSVTDRLIQRSARGLLAEHYLPERAALIQSEAYRQKMTEILEAALSPQEMEDLERYFALQERPEWATERAAINRKKEQETPLILDLMAQAVNAELENRGMRRLDQ